MTNPMREALEEIVRLSGHDNLLAEQAGPVVFARMGDIHQHASAALSASPALDKGVEAQRDFVEWVDTWVSNPVTGYSVYALDGLFGMARDKIAAIRSLSNHTSAEKA